MTGRLKITIVLVIFLFGFVIIARLFELQILKKDHLRGYSLHRDDSLVKLIPARRGEIIIKEDKEEYRLAVNSRKYNLIVSPRQIDKESLDNWIMQISPYLDIEYELNDKDVELIEENKTTADLKFLFSRLSSKTDSYELLKKEVEVEEVQQIKKLGLAGISFEPLERRFYPEKNIFSHLIGFLSKNQDCFEEQNCPNAKGQYGIEEFFDKTLAGENGEYKSDVDALGNIIPSQRYIIKPAKDGADIIITIDRSIQFFVCNTLVEAVNEYEAESGSILVADPKTGAILAMCNYPFFDSNKFFEEDISLFKNNAISSAFEPGSVFKVITMAMGIDLGLVKPESTYNDKGYIEIEDYIIKNVDEKSFGITTMNNVLEQSINTGAVFVADLIGINNFRNYTKKFGLGSLTGIGLAGEAKANIDNLTKKSKTYLATASYGHGISVTPIQMLNAISVIANSGKLMKPYIVKSIISPDKEKIIYSPEFIRQVISPYTAATITSMMVSVLENGYGRRAKVKGYQVSGKTGTAIIPKKGGGYLEEGVIHSFVGFAPAFNPKFVALVKLDKPKQHRFADLTSAPCFGKIAEFILNYYNVPLDKEN